MNGQDEGDPVDPESMALEQLRRRYEELRADYEALLTRLDQLEQLEEQPEPSPVAPPAVPVYGLREQVVAPLLALRDEYADAHSTIGHLIDGLEVLSSRGLKGQRPVEADHGPASVEVRVRGRSPGQLLGFRDRLSQVEGVSRVSIHAVDPERAVLVVELEGTR